MGSFFVPHRSSLQPFGRFGYQTNVTTQRFTTRLEEAAVAILRVLRCRVVFGIRSLFLAEKMFIANPD